MKGKQRFCFIKMISCALYLQVFGCIGNPQILNSAEDVASRAPPIPNVSARDNKEPLTALGTYRWEQTKDCAATHTYLERR